MDKMFEEAYIEKLLEDGRIYEVEYIRKYGIESIYDTFLNSNKVGRERAYKRALEEGRKIPPIPKGCKT